MTAPVRLPLDLLTSEPWAVLRSTLQRYLDLASGEVFAPEAAVRPRSESRRDGVIGVVPIHGVIEHRQTLLGSLMGGTSVEAIRDDLSAAAADEDVSAILLDIDSPGGGVVGITELAAEIRALRESKPIVAVANGTAASAAYWLAAQADRVYSIPSGQVGSVGVYAIHQDISGALEQEGVRATIISAGEYKAEGNELEPLTDDARATMQHRVDAHYAQFVADVAAGRDVTTERVEEDYGQGRTLLASDALEAGLIDHIGTVGDAVRQVAREMRAGSLRAEAPDERLPFGQRVLDQATDLSALVIHARKRADLRDREERPHFSQNVEAALRSIRDDALSLSGLLADEPPAEPDDEPVVDEPPEPVTHPAPPPPRFASRAAWLHYLETR